MVVSGLCGRTYAITLVAYRVLFPNSWRIPVLLVVLVVLIVLFELWMLGNTGECSCIPNPLSLSSLPYIRKDVDTCVSGWVIG